ncbi:MAG: ABC transporter permease subunit [Kofleriaceae bacterium]|nr:ABC transporter permease subunit [Myxococcales bacterium]MCB9575246.1 ABC transporter permease subunit [Kofleriaceae bacterium]
MSTPPDRLAGGAVAHVLAHELGAHRRTFLRWVIPMAALLAMVAALQPSMAGDGGVLAAKLAAMPAAFRRAFGLEAFDLARPAGYLATYFVYVSLTAALLGASLGATLVAKEEARRTGELLLTQPVARTQVLLGKAGAAAIYAVAYNLVLAVVAIVALAIAVDGPAQASLIAGMFAGAAALGVCFAGVGMLVATLGREPRGAAQVAMGVVLAAYLVGAVAAIAPAAHALGYLSPFRAVMPADVIAGGGAAPLPLIALVAVGVVAAAAAIARYARKDIHA